MTFIIILADISNFFSLLNIFDLLEFCITSLNGYFLHFFALEILNLIGDIDFHASWKKSLHGRHREKESLF